MPLLWNDDPKPEPPENEPAPWEEEGDWEDGSLAFVVITLIVLAGAVISQLSR